MAYILGKIVDRSTNRTMTGVKIKDSTTGTVGDKVFWGAQAEPPYMVGFALNDTTNYALANTKGTFNNSYGAGLVFNPNSLTVDVANIASVYDTAADPTKDPETKSLTKVAAKSITNTPVIFGKFGTGSDTYESYGSITSNQYKTDSIKAYYSAIHPQYLAYVCTPGFNNCLFSTTSLNVTEVLGGEDIASQINCLTITEDHGDFIFIGPSSKIDVCIPTRTYIGFYNQSSSTVYQNQVKIVYTPSTVVFQPEGRVSVSSYSNTVTTINITEGSMEKFYYDAVINAGTDNELYLSPVVKKGRTVTHTESIYALYDKNNNFIQNLEWGSNILPLSLNGTYQISHRWQYSTTSEVVKVWEELQKEYPSAYCVNANVGFVVNY